MIERENKYIGELPDGYEYKFLRIGDEIRIIGVSLDKAPIGYTLKDGELKEIKVD